MKHIKTLGLLAVAVMALTAVFGAAPASAVKFTAGKAGAKLNTSTLQKQIYTVTGSSVECTSYTLTGSTEGTEGESQMVTGKAEGCTAFGFASTVTVTSCTATLFANGNATLENSGGTCSITIKVNNVFAQCEVIIGAQSGGGATYSNGSGDIAVNGNSTAVKDEVKVSSGLCPLTVGSHSNSSITGETTVQAEGTTISWDA